MKNKECEGRDGCKEKRIKKECERKEKRKEHKIEEKRNNVGEIKQM